MQISHFKIESSPQRETQRILNPAKVGCYSNSVRESIPGFGGTESRSFYAVARPRQAEFKTGWVRQKWAIKQRIKFAKYHLASKHAIGNPES